MEAAMDRPPELRTSGEVLVAPTLERGVVEGAGEQAMQLVMLVGLQGSGYYFRSVASECLARNDAREGKQRIPARGVLGTAARLELPSLDEGFDALYYVKLTEGGFAVSEWQP
jgi:hypothetical protein